MINEDTRVQFTKNRFYDALVGLLEEKSIGYITVKELCEAAGINRGTFYLHYSSPKDVLRELEEGLRDDTTECLTVTQKELAEGLRKLLSFRRQLAAILSKNGDSDFLRDICSQLIAEKLEELRRIFPEASEGEIELVYRYNFAGASMLISEWLASENPVSPEELSELLLRLWNGTYSVLKRSEDRR